MRRFTALIVGMICVVAERGGAQAGSAHLDVGRPLAHFDNPYALETGRFTSAVALPDGSVAAVTDESPFVAVYSPNSPHARFLKPPAARPGGLHLSRVVTDERGITAFDRVGSQIVRYPAHDWAAAEPTLVPAPHGTSDFCVMGRDQVMFSWEGGGLVYVRDTITMLQRRVAVSLNPAGYPDRARQLPMRVVCIADSQSFIVVPEYEPTIRRYTSDGRLLWSHTLPAFRAIAVLNESAVGMTRHTPSGGNYQLSAAFAVAPGVLALQYILHDVTTLGIDQRSGDQVYLIRLADGAVIGTDHLPDRVVGAAPGRLFVVAHNDPTHLVEEPFRFVDVGAAQ